jgi:hypothetical protein
MMMLFNKPIAAGLTAAIALGAALAPGGTANAAPLSASSQAVKNAAPSDVIDVRRYRGYGWGGGAAVAGLALGIMGAAIAARRYDYGPYYGYGPYYAGAYPYGYYPYRPYRYRYRHYRPYRYYW